MFLLISARYELQTSKLTHPSSNCADGICLQIWWWYVIQSSLWHLRLQYHAKHTVHRTIPSALQK